MFGAINTLGDIYRLIREQHIDEAVDVLFKYVDDLLTANKFKECDDFLKEVDLKRLDVNLIVALLSVTRAAKETLLYRTEFLIHAGARLFELAPERAERLRSPE